MVGKKCLGIFLLVISILILSFILAAPNEPTNLVFSSNVTAAFDEGNFSVNWTAPGAGETPKNYSVYLFADNTLYKKDWNNSDTGYSFNNWTEANYTFIIGTVNATGTETNSTSNISIYVDRTAPVITLPLYTNGTAKKNTAQLTLNISVADASSGEEGSVCLIDVNGTSNQSVAVSSGWCNSTAINLTGSTDGNHTLRIYVNDTVNILGLNDSFAVQVDTTAPTASFSCSPSSVSIGSVVTCTCGGSDSGSGINSSATSEATVVTTAESGTFTVTACSVTDYAGNSASASASYTVEGGGGSSSTTQKEEKAHSLSKITPGVAEIVKDFDKDFGIKQIQVKVNNEAQNVKITVTKYSSKPAAVSVGKTGKVYKYLQIETENLKEKLDKAILTTQINKSWASNNGLDKEDISVFKFDETSKEWNELETTYSSSDNNYYYYTSELTSFSYFAIGEKTTEVEDKKDSIPELGEDLAWLWILIGAVVLAAFIGWKTMDKRKKQ